MKSLRGQLLISSGGLYDPNFRHTVVLIGEHNADGALGVVLNRALDVTVEQAIPPLSDLVPPGAPLFQGGPVRPESPVLLAELADPDLVDILVFGSVGFLVGDVSKDIRPSVLRARVYAGYSGWGPGQLEAEMAGDSWIVEPAGVEDVFTDAPELLWSRVLERKGPEYRRLSRMPYDPSMN
jgi:putative transcriptional regulator